MELDNLQADGVKIEHNDNELITTLSMKKPNIFMKVALGFLIILSGIMTLLMLLKILTSGEFKIFNFIFLGVLVMSTYYLTRLLAWNLYGEERIHVKGNSLKYVAHYKWFNDSTIEFEKSLLEIHLLDKPVRKNGMFKLSLEQEEKKVVTVSEKTESQMNQIKEHLMNF